MSSSSIILEIIGVDKASKSFNKVSTAMEKSEDRAKKLKIGGAIAMTALAAGAVEFAKKSIDKFQQVGGETIKLQRIIGGSATTVSQLRFAAEETGISATQLGVGFGALSKHMTANDKAWKSIGVSAKDAHGKTKPMADLIPEIADKFAKLPAGPAKTALAMNLFGRSGKDLLPFLNKGKTGLKDLAKESDKYGDTLNGKETDAVKKNIIAKRQLNAAISGLEIQLGQHLVPILASVVGFLSSTVVWFSNLSGGVKTAIGIAALLVGVIVAIVQVTKAWTAVQAALDIVMSANPIALVVVGIALLVAGIIVAYKKSATFRAIVKGAFDAVKTAGHAMWTGLKAAFNFIVDAFLTMAQTIVDAAAKMFGWVPGLGGKLRKAAAAVDAFKAKWDAIHSKTVTLSVKVTAKTAASLASTYSSQVPTFTTGKKHKKGKGSSDDIPHASGGAVYPGQAYWVGEQGPEEFISGTAGSIVPRGGRAGSGGAPIFLTIDQRGSIISGQGHAFAKTVTEALQNYARGTGRPIQVRTLGPT